MSKTNCWEFKSCGREQGGTRTGELGACPASTEKELDGVRGGQNAGRACWVVANSLCDGTVQGKITEKFGVCQECDFFMTVKLEEGANMEKLVTLLKRVGTA